MKGIQTPHNNLPRNSLVNPKLKESPLKNGKIAKKNLVAAALTSVAEAWRYNKGFLFGSGYGSGKILTSSFQNGELSSHAIHKAKESTIKDLIYPTSTSMKTREALQLWLPKEEWVLISPLLNRPKSKWQLIHSGQADARSGQADARSGQADARSGQADR